MLSIAIPVYNFEVSELCSTLSQQSKAAGIEFEILVMDDKSDDPYRQSNRKIEQFDGVSYHELDQNIGRSAIRNKLGKEAQFDKLLFMDCDSRPEQDNYIQNYLPYFEHDLVVYGGRSYEKSSPSPEFILRWKYGIERESKSAAERQVEPYRSFMTNNFLCSKKTLENCPFNEALQGYGHEDTLFALDLKEKGVEIKHIDNPLCHIGLESAAEYLEKTKEGVINLAMIIKMGKQGGRNKLYRTYLRLKKFGMLKAFQFYAKKNEQKMLNNLSSESPKLRYFDLLKLYYLSQSL